MTFPEEVDMRFGMVWLFAVGCGDKITGTVVMTDPVGACPSDRPITEADLDCICGISSTLIDTILADTCDELWCYPDDLELECVVYGEDTTPSSSSSSSSSSTEDSGTYGGSGT